MKNEDAYQIGLSRMLRFNVHMFRNRIVGLIICYNVWYVHENTLSPPSMHGVVFMCVVISGCTRGALACMNFA